MGLLPPTPTFGDFKAVVASFMNRDVSDMENVAPIVTQAINNAKRFIERQFDFEYLKDTCELTIDLSKGGSLDLVQPAMDVKRVYCAVLHNTNGQTFPDGTIRNFTFPIDIKSEQFHIELWKKKTQGGPWALSTNYNNVWNGNYWHTNEHGYFYLYRRNRDLFLAPNTCLPNNPTSVDATLQVYKYSDLYVNDIDTDFMLKYCADYLLYRSVRELNYYLKEDSRVQISNSVMTEAFQSLIAWNASLANDDDDLTLD